MEQTGQTVKVGIQLTKAEKVGFCTSLAVMFLCAILIVSVAYTTYESNPVPIFNNVPARSLNTPFQSVAQRGTLCSYTVTITTAVSLLNASSSGKVYLEISPDNTTWTVINSAGITSTLSVSITVGLNQSTDYNLQGSFPKGWYCRLRTVTTGGATIAMTSGQEVMF